MTNILVVIRRIRNSFPESTIVYTRGGCIKFAMILQELYPEGKILFDMNHAVFELDNVCYDIEGITQKQDGHIDIMEYGFLAVFDFMTEGPENQEFITYKSKMNGDK